MRRLIILIALLSLPARAAEEENLINEAQADLAGNVCSAADELYDLSQQWEHQTRLEKASGVIDLDMKRILGSRVLDAFDRLSGSAKEFQKATAKNKVKHLNALYFCADETTEKRLEQADKILHLQKFAKKGTK